MSGAGNIDQRITFQAQVRTPDGAGGSTLGFADVATSPTVWAAVYAIRSNETDTEGRLNAAGLYKFTVRNRFDINETHRIIWRDEPYNIRNIKRMGARELYLEIEAERGVAS